MNAFQIAVATMSLLGLVFGVILGYASRRFAVENGPVVKEIDEVLLQSRCGQCSYSGCRPYTEAVSCNSEKINRCASGGETVILKIAELLNVESQPLDGETPGLTLARMVAIINENNCTGCIKCIQVCSVDTIVGATRATHTVVSDLCTSCNLYADPCPTHCISLQSAAETPDS